MKKRSIVTLVTAAAIATLALAGCGNSATSNEATTNNEAASNETTTATTSTDAAVGVGEAAGFTEIPIFEDEEIEFLNVSAVYFQPVPMSNGNEDITPFNLHLEADISALSNDLGYGVGDWVPYLTVDYKVIGSDGSTAAEGTFMTMSASDGPHYGANIALPNADTYGLEITIHSPEENGYLLHTDAETGPGGSFDTYFGNGNLVVSYEGWEYTPQEW